MCAYAPATSCWPRHVCARSSLATPPPRPDMQFTTCACVLYRVWFRFPLPTTTLPSLSPFRHDVSELQPQLQSFQSHTVLRYAVPEQVCVCCAPYPLRKNRKHQRPLRPHWRARLCILHQQLQHHRVGPRGHPAGVSVRHEPGHQLHQRGGGECGGHQTRQWAVPRG